MKIRQYLLRNNEDVVTGNVGGTTTKDIAQYPQRLFTSPIRRKKKKDDEDELTIDENLIKDFCDLLSTDKNLNESILPQSLFDSLKKIGKLVGLRIEKSDTIFKHIADAEEKIVDFFRLICLYIIAPKSEKSSLKSEIISEFKKINRQKLMLFLLRLDQFSLHLTTIITHALSTIVGIEIIPYPTWHDDIEYIIKSLHSIKEVLLKISLSQKDIDAFDHFYHQIQNLKNSIKIKNK